MKRGTTCTYKEVSHMKWKTWWNGKEYYPHQLDTGHIQNIIIKITEKIEACDKLGLGVFKIYGYSGIVWIRAFRYELELRGIINQYSTKN